MSDFINFVVTLASTPRLAIALLAEALQKASGPVVLALLVLGGGLVARHYWKRRHAPVTAEVPITQEDQAFRDWYTERTRKAKSSCDEEMAKRLYVVYLNNIDIIEKQRKSEVER